MQKSMPGKKCKTSGSAQSDPCGTSSLPSSSTTCISTVTQKRPSKSMLCRSSKRSKTSGSAQSDPCGTSSPPSSSTTCISTVTSFSQDECCECLRTYIEDVNQGTGLEWVKCACGRWLHEECIDSVQQDLDGKERFCSNCIV